MKEYFPDKWVVVDYTSKINSPCCSIMAGWYGGFAGSDSWRRSSPIASVEYVKDAEVEHWIATTGSGTKYFLYPGTIGVSMLTSGLLSQANLEYIGEWGEVCNIFKEWNNV